MHAYSPTEWAVALDAAGPQLPGELASAFERGALHPRDMTVTRCCRGTHAYLGPTHTEWPVARAPDGTPRCEGRLRVGGE